MSIIITDAQFEQDPITSGKRAAVDLSYQTDPKHTKVAVEAHPPESFTISPSEVTIDPSSNSDVCYVTVTRTDDHPDSCTVKFTLGSTYRYAVTGVVDQSQQPALLKVSKLLHAHGVSFTLTAHVKPLDKTKKKREGMR